MQGTVAASRPVGGRAEPFPGCAPGPLPRRGRVPSAVPCPAGPSGSVPGNRARTELQLSVMPPFLVKRHDGGAGAVLKASTCRKKP